LWDRDFAKFSAIRYEKLTDKNKEKNSDNIFVSPVILSVTYRYLNMSLRIVKNFDATFTLDSQAEEILFSLLTHATFTEQISQKLGETGIRFTELLFQPVPYSQQTPKGMPGEFEQYHNHADYIIINVPPNFMFQAKIFKPSRLCAIYRRVNRSY